MTSATIVSLIGMLAALFLAVRAARSQTIAPKQRVIQALIWAAIIVAVALAIGTLQEHPSQYFT